MTSEERWADWQMLYDRRLARLLEAGVGPEEAKDHASFGATQEICLRGIGDLFRKRRQRVAP